MGQRLYQHDEVDFSYLSFVFNKLFFYKIQVYMLTFKESVNIQLHFVSIFMFILFSEIKIELENRLHCIDIYDEDRII